jgi:hypothetical protein
LFGFGFPYFTGLVDTAFVCNFAALIMGLADNALNDL